MGSLQTAILQSKEASFNIQLRLQKVYQIFRSYLYKEMKKIRNFPGFQKLVDF